MLSYSGLINKGKVTLPSVDTWGTNMNIIKDPPRSITLRRVDKVGDSNDITKMIDNSDRCSESIMRFARGVNPMVSVSYSNNGGGQQAYLPYTINKDGDFHAPVPAPFDLLPLSRMPRNTTSATSNPTLPHFGKELPNSRNVITTSSVKENIISASVKPTKTYKLQKPFQEGFDVKYNIQSVLPKSYESKPTMTSDKTNKINLLPSSNQINYDNLIASATTNIQDYKHNVNKSDVDTHRYLQDTNAHSVYSNLKKKSGTTNDIDLSKMKTKDYTLIEYKTPMKAANEKVSFIHENFELERNLPEYSSRTNNRGNEQVSYIHKDIELDRVLPEYSSRTNIKQNTQKNINHEHMREYERKMYLSQMSTNNSDRGEYNISSRDYVLDDMLQLGEYNVPGTIPMMDRMQEVNEDFETSKSKMGKVVMEQFQSRYNK